MEEELDSLALHLDEHGELEFSRVLLHSSILHDLVRSHSPQTTQQVVFLAGGPASGKSRLAKALSLPIDAVHIDVDEIRAMLPEYAGWQLDRPERAALLTHREASDIAKRAFSAALLLGISVVFDAVGGDDEGSFSEKIQAAIDAGHSVRVCYANCPVVAALEREKQRFSATGRKVPEAVLVAKHAEVSRGIYNVAKLRVDLIEVFETSGDHPVLLASGPGGSGLDGLVVVQPEGYAAFLEKGSAS